jgi:hypothetical protein
MSLANRVDFKGSISIKDVGLCGFITTSMMGAANHESNKALVA